MSTMNTMPESQQVPDDWVLRQPVYGCGFGEAIRRFFIKYADFTGRASRSEYWFAQLFLIIAGMITSAVNGFILTGTTFGSHDNPMIGIWMIVYVAWALAIIIPQYALLTRRFHDINKSGKWVIVFAVGGIGGTILTIIGFFAAASSFIAFADATTSSLEPSAGSGGLILAGIVLMLASGITSFIFTLLKSDPAGMRFDKYVNHPLYQQSVQAQVQQYPTGTADNTVDNAYMRQQAMSYQDLNANVGNDNHPSVPPMA